MKAQRKDKRRVAVADERNRVIGIGDCLKTLQKLNKDRRVSLSKRWRLFWDFYYLQ